MKYTKLPYKSTESAELAEALQDTDLSTHIIHTDPEALLMSTGEVVFESPENILGLVRGGFDGVMLPGGLSVGVRQRKDGGFDQQYVGLHAEVEDGKMVGIARLMSPSTVMYTPDGKPERNRTLTGSMSLVRSSVQNMLKLWLVASKDTDGTLTSKAFLRSNPVKRETPQFQAMKDLEIQVEYVAAHQLTGVDLPDELAESIVANWKVFMGCSGEEYDEQAVGALNALVEGAENIIRNGMAAN